MLLALIHAGLVIDLPLPAGVMTSAAGRANLSVLGALVLVLVLVLLWVIHAGSVDPLPLPAGPRCKRLVSSGSACSGCSFVLVLVGLGGVQLTSMVFAPVLFLALPVPGMFHG